MHDNTQSKKKRRTWRRCDEQRNATTHRKIGEHREHALNIRKKELTAK